MAIGPDVEPKMPSGSSLIRAKPDSPPAFLLDCSTNNFWLRQELFTLPCHSWSKTTNGILLFHSDLRSNYTTVIPSHNNSITATKELKQLNSRLRGFICVST